MIVGGWRLEAGGWTRTARRLLVAAAILGAAPAPAGAHRLDEYLQAARIAVGVDRVDIEIDLTPGVAVAPAILDAIDLDHDGRIGPAERAGYASRVIADVTVAVDGTRLPLALAGDRFPSESEMRLGVGIIQLRATAALPHAGVGRHIVSFTNRHRAEQSVFLANALMAADDRIRIDAQRRDVRQQQLDVDYRVVPDARTLGIAWLSVFFATAVGLVFYRSGWPSRNAATRSNASGDASNSDAT